ncbi:DUF262 domain-containing protein [Acidaminococcus provencensis]|uniref:DUF262 domain-containing protein n=1 Tax=Acidaminococcus provencensis TaxID=2058289 RepID=UPI0022E5F2E6|nr:DUF262 domain-containing protein [Acidaminococcus provencensis]
MNTDYAGLEDEELSITSYDVSVIPNDFNVMTINNLIEKSVIKMPVFQRNYVWDRKRASRFIESLIIGLPVPQIFLYLIAKNQYSVIDGQQRLMSIYFFIKQRFPKPGKRAAIREIFDKFGNIPENILNDNEYFQEFKLTFARQENGKPHPLNGKKYLTLEAAQRDSFELMPIRCMSIRQNKPDDNGAMYEIFNRLNTGGMNLSPQEIRGCLYDSNFYHALYKWNTFEEWRKLIGKPADDKFRDVEMILRSFALAYDGDSYTGSMLLFLNRFSKKAQDFSEDEIERCEDTFSKIISICSKIDRSVFLTRTRSFNVAFFEAVFVTIAKEIKANKLHNIKVTQEAFDGLKQDEDFVKAITHSTSHADSVRKRLELAQKYLLIEEG